MRVIEHLKQQGIVPRVEYSAVLTRALERAYAFGFLTADEKQKADIAANKRPPLPPSDPHLKDAWEIYARAVHRLNEMLAARLVVGDVPAPDAWNEIERDILSP